MSDKREKVVVIGGGPAGLAAAIYLSRAQLKPLVFAGSPPGGQLVLTSEVENYPGVATILGAQLVENMRHQAESFGARIVNENINTVNLDKKPFDLRYGVVDKETSVKTDSLLIATGARARWLGLPSETRLRGKGVSACATCDGFFFKDKVVAVVGGGDTACEEALVLTKFASKVYILYRRDKLRASKIMQVRVLNNPKVEIIWNSVVDEVLGENKVEGVKLKVKIPSNKSQVPNKFQVTNHKFQTLKEKKFDDWNLVLGILPLDGLFIAIGHRPDTDIFKGQIQLGERGYVITSARMALELARQNKQYGKYDRGSFDFQYQTITSVPGAFAAGDCVDFQYQQAATAAGMGVQAALEIGKWLEAKG